MADARGGIGVTGLGCLILCDCAEDAEGRVGSWATKPHEGHLFESVFSG